jgi:hypothetical protein
MKHSIFSKKKAFRPQNPRGLLCPFSKKKFFFGEAKIEHFFFIFLFRTQASYERAPQGARCFRVFDFKPEMRLARARGGEVAGPVSRVALKPATLRGQCDVRRSLDAMQIAHTRF